VIIKQLENAQKGDTTSAKFLLEITGEKPTENTSKETPPPIVNIEIKDNSEVQKEFEKFDT
jgi:hypothetical protein